MAGAGDVVGLSLGSDRAVDGQTALQGPIREVRGARARLRQHRGVDRHVRGKIGGAPPRRDQDVHLADEPGRVGAGHVGLQIVACDVDATAARYRHRFAIGALHVRAARIIEEEDAAGWDGHCRRARGREVAGHRARRDLRHRDLSVVQSDQVPLVGAAERGVVGARRCGRRLDLAHVRQHLREVHGDRASGPQVYGAARVHERVGVHHLAGHVPRVGDRAIGAHVPGDRGSRADRDVGVDQEHVVGECREPYRRHNRHARVVRVPDGPQGQGSTRRGRGRSHPVGPVDTHADPPGVGVREEVVVVLTQLVQIRVDAGIGDVHGLCGPRAGARAVLLPHRECDETRHQEEHHGAHHGDHEQRVTAIVAAELSQSSEP